MLRPVAPETLDHVALWVADRDPIADFVTERVGMHVVDRTDAFTLVGSGEESSVETNFGVRSRPLRWLYLATRELSWRVMTIEKADGEDEDTFCAVVPDKHAFTLAGGVYTGNCGACEPECPVEAIFPEDALPQKWEPFVKINYAYGDADVINKLVDEYAEEHNVQNEPLE
jgi:ferredoxin